MLWPTGYPGVPFEPQDLLTELNLHHKKCNRVPIAKCGAKCGSDTFSICSGNINSGSRSDIDKNKDDYTDRGRTRFPVFCACTRGVKHRDKSKNGKHNKSSTKWYIKQPTWRLWGEERADGALYTVYLKKVRYHRPNTTVSSLQDTNGDDNDEISHLEWETVRVRFVKAGTLKKLVAALATDDGELESTYVNVFLATYRSFSTARQVLSLLLERYEELLQQQDAVTTQPDTAEQHRKTLVSALHVWLDSYPEDFREPPDFPSLQQLLAFTTRYLPGTDLDSKAKNRFDQYRRIATTSCPHDPNALLPLYNSVPLCLRNGYTVGGHLVRQVYTFPDVPVRHFAEQLTRMDTELFKKLVPHQCLGAVWSRRDKSRSHEAATVLATVNQFNAVSFRVISTILVEQNIKPTERANTIICWIDIAQELRVLKNFSSLKAIISGLQSNPIYRLQKIWQVLPKEKFELFEELARIFSEDNNQWAQRELLMREGTAKFADTVGENDKQLQKVFQKQHNHSANISFGTIPYLGTFLTDLTMIDTAIPDTISDGLINFDKRRKEFEVLAQIKLLQGAANAYHLPEDRAFDRWFDSVLVLDDREAYQLSCQIEPATNSALGLPKINKTKQKTNSLGHKKNDSIASTSSSNSSQFYCDIDSVPSSPHNSLDRKVSPSRMSDSSSNSSLPSLDTSLNSSHSSSATNKLLTSGTLSPNHSQKSSPEFYIIRVTYETDCVETDGIVLYKSIMLSNNERTPQVIRNAMLKLCLDGNPDNYTLAQVLPDKELVLPPNANVYYAVNTAFNLNFILRPKKDSTDGSISGKTGKQKK